MLPILPSPRRPRCRLRQAPSSSRLPTPHLCPLRWPTHRPRPPLHPPTQPGRLATLFTRTHASRNGLYVCAKAAVDDDAGGDGGRGVAEPAQQECCGEQTRRPSHSCGGRGRCLALGPAPGGKAVSDGRGCRRRRIATPAWAWALLANNDVGVIVGRGRWDDSWHKIVILNDCGQLHSTNYRKDNTCRFVCSLYYVK